jgi:acetoin:2,6-dichlorophenolindophenol oxidoreductase subunit alpha
VVFVVEDNDWGISVPRRASTSVGNNADRAVANGMPGVRVEDNDVEAVWEAARTAVERARAGEGPSLIEVHTLRMWGHFEGDAQGYRPDLDEITGHDPIPAYADKLVASGQLDSAAVDRIHAAASERVEDAVTFAKASAVPEAATAHHYVFNERSMQ